MYPALSRLNHVETYFTKEELIGEGALKKVYKAYDTQSQRFIALARPQDNLQEEFHEDFIHEAWLTSSLNHPNIIKIYEVGLDPSGMPFFSMDLKGNQTLDKFAQSGATLNEKLEVFLKVCDAISYAHSKGVCHLDLKPENIQCDEHGEVLVCDWGLGKCDREIEHNPELSALQIARNTTLYGVVKGTIGYMSPEQAQLDTLKDYRSDVYSLGCILYYICTGYSPYEIDGERGDLENIRRGEYNKERLATLNESLRAVIINALQLDPVARYGSVEDLRQDIERYRRGFPTQAEAASTVRRLSLFCSRNRVILSLVAVCTIIFFGLGVSNVISYVTKSKSDEQLSEVASRLETSNLESEVLAQALQEEIPHINAHILKGASNFLSDLVVSEDPVDFVRRREALFNAAYEMSHGNISAAQMLIMSRAVKLDFKAACEIKRYPKRMQKRIGFISGLRDWSFSSELRPTVEEMVYFFNRCVEEQFFDYRFIEAIMVYDLSLRNSEEERLKVFSAYLQVLNGGQDISVEVRPSTRGKNVRIEAQHGLRFSVPHGAQRSCLSFVPLDHLVIKAQFLRLHCLGGCSTRILDLSGVQNLEIDKAVEIQGLEELVVSEAQERLLDSLRSILKVDEEYKVRIKRCL